MDAKGIVRVGTVTDTDAARSMVRVKYRDAGFTSGWLYVLQHRGAEVDTPPAGEHKHDIYDTYTGGGDSEKAGTHIHAESTVTVWMPKVNDTVVVLYLPIWDGDGFVLGGV